MKLKKLLISTALVVAGAALFQTAAKAQASNGDLFLGFQTTGTGSTINMEVNLGADTLFEGLVPGTVIDLTVNQPSNTASEGYGSMSLTDLTQIYGSTPSSLYLGVVGQGTASNEILLGTPVGLVPVPSSNQSALYNSVGNMTGYYNAGYDGSAYSAGSPTPTYGAGTDVFVVASTTALGSYTEVAGISGSFSNATPGGANAQALYSATGTEKLNVYDLVQGASHATDLGYITLDAADGAGGEFLTFTAAPEPSTYALFGLGALVMIVALRRRNQLQS
jgi:hypothetical protein